jgi:hypothetical protein
LCGLSGLMCSLIGAVKKNALPDSDSYQEQSKKRQQSVSNLEPSSKKYIVLRSLLGAFLGLIICMPLGVCGGVIILNRRYWLDSFCLCLSVVQVSRISLSQGLFEFSEVSRKPWVGQPVSRKRGFPADLRREIRRASPPTWLVSTTCTVSPGPHLVEAVPSSTS